MECKVAMGSVFYFILFKHFKDRSRHSPKVDAGQSLENLLLV